MAIETFSLTGKTALITGSGRENGIGAGIAKALARNGASVALHYVSAGSKSRAEKLAADISHEFGTKTTVVHGSVDDPAAVSRMVQDTLKALAVPHIDILVNNAGVGTVKPLMEVTPKQLFEEFSVNAFGTVYLTQATVDIGKMPRGGRIINIGSIVSKQGPQGTAIYAAAKAAQDSLTASWAGELGRTHGITVNTLAPGPVPTDMSKPFLETSDGDATEMQAVFHNMTRAEARLGTVEDLADAVLLIVSGKSRWITAQWISVSGGITGTM